MAVKDLNNDGIIQPYEEAQYKEALKKEEETASKESLDKADKNKKSIDKAKEISTNVQGHYAGGGTPMQPKQSLETKEDIKNAQDIIKDKEADKKAEKETKKNLKKQADANNQALLGYIMSNNLPINEEELMKRAEEDPKLRSIMEESLKSNKALGDDSFSTSKLIESLRVAGEKDKTESQKAQEATEEGKDSSKGVTKEQMEERVEENKANEEQMNKEYEENKANNGKVPTSTPTQKTNTQTPTPEPKDEEVVEDDGEKVNGEESVEKNKVETYRDNQKKINAYKEQLNDPNLDPLEKAKIEEQVKLMEEANDVFMNSLSTEESDIAGHAKEREQFEKYIKKQRQKGLIPGWISEGKAYGKIVKDAEAALKDAKESGDEDAIKAAEKDLADAKEAKKDMHQEYGMFLMNSLGTALGNMSIPGAYGKAAGNAESLYNQRVKSNLEAETERWNEYRDQTAKAVSDDIDRRWGENSEQKQFYNSMLKDAATKRNARELGLLDNAYKVEATRKMSEALGTDIKETIKLMSLMGMGSEQMIATTLANSDIDINALTDALGEGAQAGIDAAARGMDFLNSWLKQ